MDNCPGNNGGHAKRQRYEDAAVNETAATCVPWQPHVNASPSTNYSVKIISRFQHKKGEKQAKMRLFQ